MNPWLLGGQMLPASPAVAICYHTILGSEEDFGIHPRNANKVDRASLS